MTLSSGTRLGAYEILTLLGSGGMGEVYKARDTRLDRTVAIKILPSAEPALKARFDREAKAIAALTHPHICTLYDVGHHDGTDFLVMELLEGETLAARLERGPLTLNDAQGVAIEMAAALDTAHTAGVVHRDLKPANIMLTKRGVKLVDFGIAKLRPLTPALDGFAMTTTETTPPLTMRGTLIGTLPYMSPEQLEGQDVDPRSDIWSFGCVIHEAVTGHKTFSATSHASLIAAIISADPPAMPRQETLAPPAFERIIRKCLQKDPEARWQSARDLADELRWARADASAGATRPVPARRPSRERAISIGIVATLLLAVIFLAGALWRGAPDQHAAAETLRLGLGAPDGVTLTPGGPGAATQLVIAPDGRRLAFVGSKVGGRPQIWVREFDALDARPVVGTEEAFYPFWSPDSRTIAFFAQGQLKKVGLEAKAPEAIAVAPTGRGGAWSRDGVIVFSPSINSGLSRVSAAGGAVTPLTTLTSGESAHRWPEFLPDGRHVLYFSRGERPRLSVASLDGSDEPRVVTDADSFGRFAAPGHLVFARGSSLLAQRFDVNGVTLVGEPLRIADGFFANPQLGYSGFSVVNDRMLLYSSHVAGRGEPAWVSRDGSRWQSIGSAESYYTSSLSADEQQVAFDRFNAETGYRDIWLLDVLRRVSSRLTFDPRNHINPVWSPDGTRLLYGAGHASLYDLYATTTNGAGTEQLVLQSPADKFPSDWSRDGRVVVFHAPSVANGWDVWVLEPEGGRQPAVFAASPFNEAQGRLSRDGRWMAYISDESGRLQIYVQAFPSRGAKVQVSTAGGSDPHWRGDGRELFYLASDGRMTAVPLTVTPTGLRAGIPVPLFQTELDVVATSYPGQYSVSADGQRFLLKLPVKESAAPPMTVVMNWAAPLKN